MTETRLRANYIGYPRFIRGADRKMVPAPKRKFDPGSVYVTHKLTVGFAKNGVETKMSLARRRVVEREFYETLPFIKWMVADQAEAVRRGYFLERSTVDNHVVVISLDPLKIETDADVMRDAMRRARQGDAHAVKLITFVLQQDQRGWSATWENKTIETYRPGLGWYKRLANGGPTVAPTTPRIKYYTPTGRPRGRPKGTVVDHAHRREQQTAEWRASGSTLPYAEWIKTMNYRP